MEHPVQYLAVVTKFLDRMIQEHGDRLFVILGFACLGVIGWMLTRRRRHPVHDISVVILPLGQARRREPDLEPSPFENNSGL